MMHAKVVDGVIVSRERKTNPTSATSSDGGPVWRPIVEDDKPTFDDTQDLTRSEVIEASQVRIAWTVSDKALEQAKADRIRKINKEAGARILAIMPEYKQRNALALGLNLTLDHGPDVSAWPADAKIAYAAYSALWSAISDVRTASNASVALIEAANDVAGVRSVDVVWPSA